MILYARIFLVALWVIYGILFLFLFYSCKIFHNGSRSKVSEEIETLFKKVLYFGEKPNTADGIVEVWTRSEGIA